MQRLPFEVEIRTSRKCPATSDRQICGHHWGSESCPDIDPFPFLFPCFNCSYIVLIEARKQKRKGVKKYEQHGSFQVRSDFLLLSSTAFHEAGIDKYAALNLPIVSSKRSHQESVWPLVMNVNGFS